MTINDFLKKYKWYIVILALIPVITISTFAILEYGFHKIDIKVGEWASFIGAILGYIGTVLLGLLALWQNEKANSLNREMQKLQQANYVSMVSIRKLEVNVRSVKYPSYVNSNFPDLEVINMKMDDITSDDCFQIDTAFSNDSKYPIVEIAVHAGSLTNNNCELLYGIKDISKRAIYIAKNEVANIRFIIPCKGFQSFSQKKFTLTFWFGNVFDYKTKATLFIDDMSEQKQVPYKYRLAKFTDVKPKETDNNDNN